LNKENEYETINGLSNCEIIEESRDGQINVNAAKINPEDKEISKSVPLKYNFFEKRADYSLYLFSKENFLRKFCSFITLHKWFETVTLIFVGLNCLTLAIERPNILESSIVSIISIFCILKISFVNFISRKEKYSHI
jgi:hypothetical protein